jgi:predicted DNA-binding transcriptional regulator AlpA
MNTTGTPPTDGPDTANTKRRGRRPLSEREKALRAAARKVLPPSLNDEQLISDYQVAALVGKSRSWIRAEVRVGAFPNFQRIGARGSRWRVGDVRQWMEAQRLASETGTSALRRWPLPDDQVPPEVARDRDLWPLRRLPGTEA